MTSLITIPRLIALFIALTPAVTAYAFWKTDYQACKQKSVAPIPSLFRRFSPFERVGKASSKKSLSFSRMATYVWENNGDEDEWRKTTANVRKFAKTKTSDRIKGLSSCFALDSAELMGR